MGYWDDIFEIFKDSEPVNEASTSKPSPERPTLYVFAYLDNGNPKDIEKLPIEQRFMMLEANQQQLEEEIRSLKAKNKTLIEQLKKLRDQGENHA